MGLSINVAGTKAFFDIMKIVQKDTNPDDYHWKNLFSIPGYRTLIENEFKKEFFKRNFQLAFMPSKESKRGNILNSDEDIRKRYIKHYIKAKKNKEKIFTLLNRWEQSLKAESIIEATLEYLPIRDINDYPEVSFLVFENDARGYSPIVIDVLFAINIDEFLPHLLAHEAHHFFRNKLLCFSKEDIKKEDEEIMWVINQIHSEGIADQIDKKEWFYKGYKNIHNKGLKQFARKYRESVENSSELIYKLDDKFNQIYDGLNNGEIKIKKDVPMSGHTIGFFMTNTILKVYDKSEFIKNVGNPFEFFKIYNRAAKKINETKFSKNSIKLIIELENKYKQDGRHITKDFRDAKDRLPYGTLSLSCLLQ